MLTLTQIETRVADALSMAMHSRCTSTEYTAYVQKHIRDEIGRVYPSGRRMYSRYVDGFVNGLLRASHSRIMQEMVEFVYRAPDGKLYSTHKGTSLNSTAEFYARGEGHLLGTFPRGFVWKGTDKEFVSITSKV